MLELGIRRTCEKSENSRMGRKAVAKRGNICIKLLCSYLIKDIWVHSLWCFIALRLHYKSRIVFLLPASVIKMSEVWVFLPVSYILEIGPLHQSWTSISPSGQRGEVGARMEEILKHLKCFGKGLVLGTCSCDWWDQMSDAEGWQ